MGRFKFTKADHQLDPDNPIWDVAIRATGAHIGQAWRWVGTGTLQFGPWGYEPVGSTQSRDAQSRADAANKLAEIYLATP